MQPSVSSFPPRLMYGIIRELNPPCLALDHLIILGKYFLYVNAFNNEKSSLIDFKIFNKNYLIKTKLLKILKILKFYINPRGCAWGGGGGMLTGRIEPRISARYKLEKYIAVTSGRQQKLFSAKWQNFAHFC